MQIASASNSDRSKFSEQELELAGILGRWDPIGVRPGMRPQTQGSDPTQYDDLVRPILMELGHGVGARPLAVKLAQTITRDYGLAMREQEARTVAQQIDDWWTGLDVAP